MPTSDSGIELTQVEKDTAELAVCVRSGFKEYGAKHNATTVLKSVDLNVPKGSIYGLLGASGCGKTTLLNCIIGLKQLDSGNIWVLGGPASLTNGLKIGHMPQQIALCGEFTIRESMKYFGWIAGMSFDNIRKRTYFLAELLNLPTIDSRIIDLSGGQQRRVSFATALLHEPELLILDEPTVGLDPILRESIWKHLVELTKTNLVTIILTTHYIDEAHGADTIGLMRDGLIIGEESPKTLLAQFNVNSLEEAFYKLILTGNEPTVTKRIRFPQLVDKKTEPNSFIQKHVLMGLIWKDFMWMWRNVFFVVTIFILPILTIFVFGYAIGGDPKNLTIAVVNYETDNRTCEPLMCNSTLLSCHFLRYLSKNTVNVVYYPDEDQAVLAVQQGIASASVLLRKSYTENLKIRIETKYLTDTNIKQSTIEVIRDASIKDISLFIKKYIYKSFFNFIKDYLELCGISKDIANPPLRFYKPIYGIIEPHMTDFANAGVILTLAFFMAAALTGGITLIERNEGILERSLVMGVSFIEILTAHIASLFGVMLGQCLIPLLIVFLVFNLTLNGSILNVIIFTVLSGLCGMCAGFSVSSICHEERTAVCILLGMFLPIVLLSGILWPIEGMNYYLRHISSFLPLTVATESLRSILQRGWGLNELAVYKGIIVLNVWTAIFLGVSILGLKFRKN